MTGSNELQVKLGILPAACLSDWDLFCKDSSPKPLDSKSVQREDTLSSKDSLQSFLP